MTQSTSRLWVCLNNAEGRKEEGWQKPTFYSAWLSHQDLLSKSLHWRLYKHHTTSGATSAGPLGVLWESTMSDFISTSGTFLVCQRWYQMCSFVKWFVFNWNIIASQCCVRFCCIAMWISYVVVQLLSLVGLFSTPWTAACQASLSFSISGSLLIFTTIEPAMLSNHLILCSPTSPPALNLSQHQGLFQWDGSFHQVAKILELQLQHQSFQWIFKVDLL